MSESNPPWHGLDTNKTTDPVEGRIVEYKGLRVKDLIEKLQEFSPEAPVLTNDNDYGLQNDIDVGTHKLEGTYDAGMAKDMCVELGTICVVIE